MIPITWSRVKPCFLHIDGPSIAFHTLLLLKLETASHAVWKMTVNIVIPSNPRPIMAVDISRRASLLLRSTQFRLHLLSGPLSPPAAAEPARHGHFCLGLPALSISSRKFRRSLRSPVAVMLHDNPVVSDICATALSGGIALSLLRFFEETAKRGLFDQKLNRKLVHVSVGLVFMLCWPMFSYGHRGAILAALIPGVNIIRVLLVGLGIHKDEATVKSMSRFGDYRELLKGPLYYATTITLACAVYWRTSPVGIAAVCNLCAGDGLADIVGRRFGRHKIPYNKNKSFVGSAAMAAAGFLACVGYMYYFASFGYMRDSWEMIRGFFVVSLASTLIESLPLSTELDDNLTVPLTSFLVGHLVF